MKLLKIVGALVVLFFSCVNSHSQDICQQHILSTVPATTWSTWEYISCETGELKTQSIPCCGYTLPICAIVGSVQLIDGDGFDAILVNEVGPPWESCIPYNEGPCPWDFDNDGSVGVGDLIILLGDYGSEGVGVEELSDFLSYWGFDCDDQSFINLPKDEIEYYIAKAGGKIVKSTILDINGREIYDNMVLPPGIYIIKTEWSNGFITTKKLFYEK